MKVLVIGSTGRLGSQVVARAMEAGHDVTAFARNPEAIQASEAGRASEPVQAENGSRPRIVQGDVLDPASLERGVAGRDAVISCLGTRDRRQTNLRTDGTRKLVAAMTGAGVRRLVAFSAFGVGDSRDQLKRTSFMFGRVILPLFLSGQFEDMERMESVIRSSNLEWVIVRPSALTDKPATNDVKVAADRAGKAGSSIPIADVAQFMVDSLTSDEYLRASPVIYA